MRGGACTTSTGHRAELQPSAGTVRCASVLSLAGSTSRQASWCRPPTAPSGFLAPWHAVLRLGGAASCPSPSLRPLLLRDFPLEVGQGSHERPVGAWLPCCFLGPLVHLLVASDSFVRRTPPDLYGDTWPCPPQSRNAHSSPDGVFLPWCGLVRCHPSDG